MIDYDAVILEDFDNKSYGEILSSYYIMPKYENNLANVTLTKGEIFRVCGSIIDAL